MHAFPLWSYCLEELLRERTEKSPAVLPLVYLVSLLTVLFVPNFFSKKYVHILTSGKIPSMKVRLYVSHFLYPEKTIYYPSALL